MKSNYSNLIWEQLVSQLVVKPDYVVSPRGMKCSELINGRYIVPMPAYLDLEARHVNVGFMFKEAAWILSGSNRLSDLTDYIPGYANYSDDGVFMKGAYGPKVVDQLPYIVEALSTDQSSRQAVLTIWRERPGQSKDIPCTVAMQFLIREDKLHLITTMRSQDIVLGYTYDIFTFSMIAEAVKLLLKTQGIIVTLGNLHVNAGSLHLYDDYFERAKRWAGTSIRDGDISTAVGRVLQPDHNYITLVNQLMKEARRARKSSN